ncbi:MAG: hypothetical protein KBT30_01610, partial [Clostridiales bacterium]|nr:hypothetical protein [Candidatus Apopatousia equi]
SIPNQKKVSKILLYLFTALLIFFIIAIILNPKTYINSCYNGLLTWATCVLPSLFPFFFFTKILTDLNVLDKFFNKFKKINGKLFNAPPCSAYIFGMSIISGYPVGAKIIEEFYSKGIINTKQANKLITFCSNSGPLFIIGTVGSIMFQNAKIGYILYISHILSAILNGLLYRKFYCDKNENNFENNINVDYSNILGNSMSSAITSIMVVGGFVAIFYMIIDILNGLNILMPISTLLNQLLNSIGLNGCGSAISNGIIEVTRGCLDLSKLNIPLTSLCVISSGLITFGGLSIHAQSLAFLSKCKVNIKFYFLQKITQAIFACAISYLLCLIIL